MINAAGLIFTNIHDLKIPELTRKRTMGSIPIAGRYRLIDFPLSSMVNCGMENIYVIAHHNYNSLISHIGSGKDYDLARHSGGIHIITPMMNAYANGRSESYASRLNTLVSILHVVERIDEKYVVMSDCDSVCNIDYSDMVSHHIIENFDMTVLSSGGSHAPFMAVIETELLATVVKEAAIRGYTSFSADLIERNKMELDVGFYYPDKPVLPIHSVHDYYSVSMRILKDGILRNTIFRDPLRPILSRLNNPPPAKYSDEACVNNSLIADGCEINGEVTNSIIFRKVRVGKNATVRDSIIFEQTDICDYANVQCVIADKHSSIKEKVNIISHNSMPVMIASHKIVG